MRLGQWVLEPGLQVRLQVIDERGVGVPAAVVETPLDSRLTEDSGWVELSGVPAKSSHEVRARAEGHLAARKRLLPPHDPAEEIVLPRALVVRGRLVDAEGAVLGGGQVRVENCDTWDLRPPAADGRFELALVPEESYRLVLSSPVTQAVSVEVPAGAAGEIVELGDVVLPRGGVVRGRLLSAADAAPVVGARVWMPREAADPLTAWVRRDVLQASSDAEGAFVLRGVPALPARLRIEALELAPRRLDIRFEADSNEVDVGDIELEEGHDLQVLAEGFDPEGALLRLDLAGAWREMDLVEAYFVDGAARLSRLPAGRFEVVVMRDREVLCRERVEIGGGEPAQVACGLSRVQVHGEVVAAGEPTGPGQLLWFPDTWGREAGVVIRRETATGVGRSSAFGEGLPQVDVEVLAAGSFSTDRLAAGRWRVVWQGDAGGGTEPMEIVIPEVPEHSLRIEVPGQRLWGVVLDSAGEPAQGARVRLLDSGAVAFAGPEGEFAFPALEPGRYHLKAESQGVGSSVATVELTPEAMAPVELRLGEEEPVTVPVQVRGSSGDGIGGALVVVETLEGEQRILTTGPRGNAELTMDPPWPRRLRAAGWTPAGWALGSWVGWQEAAEEGLILEVASIGELIVTAEDGAPAVDVLRSVEGWDLAALLTRLGRPPRAGPAQQVHLRGLPAGIYWLGSGGSGFTVRVERDRVETHQVSPAAQR